ncbi:2-oxo acid dehydrogenase subunit E2 [Spiroplasma floricola]|uniref:Pyruvate dehydrogenase E2 component (Dihydrolipoamide acetyltransferase) n=1 Tax=Spiroplasma floricola 23-6 TaxID=1336749 RepID=A0A2K8SF30_9MOLU|nr:2-oxo acid dehydrogenase subunit E2 [Spiroplasma floricola]AUB32046.1 pyruvate dehydrogenase E2 component (dihydrolipoamide acetyltransferase) [Spiroplasma floricola 23-6]
MVHMRVRNLPSKGILKEWLFSDEEINFGQDFALIELDDGSKINIKSNYNGIITKTINLGTSVKNGSILANIAVGEKEIQKFKNKSIKKTNSKKNNEEEIFISTQEDEPKLEGVETVADSFSGAVVYDRYNQAVTPFSTGRDDIMDTLQKVQKMEEKDQSMSQGNQQPKDKFAQMRANIKDSIKNAPQNKVIGDLTREELLKMTKEDINEEAGSNLFSTNNSSGVSKFRQLVQARKEKLLEENDFKEAQNENQVIDAMSKTDEKGRPLIMRNIIQARMEKLNNAGGDPSVLEQNIVATKSNAILDNQRLKSSANNVNSTQEVEKMKQRDFDVNLKKTLIKQGSSQDGLFGISYGSYIESDEENTIDANDLSPHSGIIMPKKKPEELVEEIIHKPTKTYAESKLSNLYDTSRRWDIIKNRDERNLINQRRKVVEKGIQEDNMDFNKKINEIGIPKEFLREVPHQDPITGAMLYIPYNQTPKGIEEFEAWLRATNLYTAYKEKQNIETTQETLSNIRVPFKRTHENIIVENTEQIEPTQDFEEEKILVKTPKIIQKEIKTEIEKKDDELVKVSDKKVADETLEFLKDQIKDLQRTLKEQNQLNAATSKLNQQSHFNAGTDTFGQMMQYMLMQNMIQNMNQNQKREPNREFNANDLKAIIKDEINSFAKDLKEKKCQEEERARLEREIIERVERDLKEKWEFDKKEREKENIQDVNFEKDKPDNSLGYLQFESNDENKVVERTKVNKNRNPAVKSMILSQNFIPPLTISTEIDMSAILKLKHMLKQTQNNIKFTTISFIAKAISIALEEYPKLNSSYDAETNEVLIKKYHHIGLATETTEGLIIPVLKFVEKLSIKEVAIDIKEVTSRLRSGELYNYEVDGSTITIANYGNIGAIQATPTIFYPNAAVVGVGKVVKKPVVVDNEKLAIKAIMNMSLTVDQRIIDAAEAGQFLAKVKSILEKPEIFTVS